MKQIEETSSLYQALYVQDYFKAKAAEAAQGRRKLLRITKRVLKQLLAVLSLIFPKLLSIRRRSKKNDDAAKQEEFVYTSLFELRPRKTYAEDRGHQGFRGATSNEEDQCASGDGDCEAQPLAELVVTLDPLTTGFLQDLQLIIQLAIDKSTFKVKAGVRAIQDFAAVTLTQTSLNDLILNRDNA